MLDKRLSFTRQPDAYNFRTARGPTSNAIYGYVHAPAIDRGVIETHYRTHIGIAIT